MKPTLLHLFEDDPIAVAVLGAIRGGDMESLRLRLRETPELATAMLTRRPRGAQPLYSYPLIGAATAGMPPAAFPWGGSEGATAAGACNIAFWCACHGGQRGAAESLLGRGAVLDWVSPWDGLSPLDAARRSQAHDVAEWLESLGARSAKG